MNKIDKLISELCPEGVETKTLGEIAEVRSGWGFPHAYQGQTDGTYPFYKVSDMNLRGNERLMNIANNYVDEKTLRKLGVKPAPAGTVIFPKIGAAVATNKKRLLSTDSAYDNNVMGLIPRERVQARFLFYWMQTINLSTIANDSGAVPSIRKSEMASVLIPIPPLAIQQEIVKILDTFTKLEAELEAELEARKKQYEYYRDELLTFGEDVVWKELRLIAIFSQGIQVHPTKQFLEKPDNFVRFLRIVDFVKDDELPRYIKNPGDRYIKSEGDLVMIRYGATAAGKVFLKYSGAIANNMFQIKLTTKEITVPYLHCYLSQTKIYRILNSNGGSSTMPAITFGQIGAVKIPIPPLAEQNRIVAILDKFDALVNDISVGLPAELSARRKQYEYYRNKLLMFEPLEKDYE